MRPPSCVYACGISESSLLRHVGSGEGVECGGVDGEVLKFRSVRSLKGISDPHVARCCLLAPIELSFEPREPVLLSAVFGLGLDEFAACCL